MSYRAYPAVAVVHTNYSSKRINPPGADTVAPGMLMDPGEGSRIHLDPMTKLHVGSRVPLWSHGKTCCWIDDPSGSHDKNEVWVYNHIGSHDKGLCQIYDPIGTHLINEAINVVSSLDLERA